MAGIIPEASSGGVVVRTAGGACQTPTGVTNSYCPDSDFSANCALNFLPDDCSARITAAQINAFQSEMLCFAETLYPDGNWNCSSTCNLGRLFDIWRTSNSDTYDSSFFNTLQVHLCENTDSLTDFADIEAKHLICDGNGNVLTATEVQLAQNVVDWVCADGGLAQELSGCLISSDADNELEQGSDGKLYVAVDSADICGEAVDLGTGINDTQRLFMFCNGDEIGTMTVDNAHLNFAAAICFDQPAGIRSDFMNCFISTDADNTIVQGNDGRLYTTAEATTSVVDTVLDAGNVIARHNDGDGNVTRIRETVTSLVNNTDNTATFTSEDGTQVTFCVPDITNIQCTWSQLNITECGGDVRHIVPSITSSRITTPSDMVLDGTIPVNTIFGPWFTDVRSGICNQRMQVLGSMSWVRRECNDLTGGFAFIMQVSDDGGATWETMFRGGNEARYRSDIAFEQEIEFQRHDDRLLIGGNSLNTYGIRYVLVANTLGDCQWLSSSQGATFYTNRFNCCDA